MYVKHWRETSYSNASFELRGHDGTLHTGESKKERSVNIIISSTSFHFLSYQRNVSLFHQSLSTE